MMIILDLFPSNFVDFIIENHSVSLSKTGEYIGGVYIMSLTDILTQNPSSTCNYIDIAKKTNRNAKLVYSLNSHTFYKQKLFKTVDYTNYESVKEYKSWPELLKVYKPFDSRTHKVYSEQFRYLLNKISFLQNHIDFSPPINGGIIYQMSLQHFKSNGNLNLRKSF